MPKVEDFPAVAQKAMRASQTDEPQEGVRAQKKKVGFFERLTGRRSASPAEPEIVRDKEPSLGKSKDAGSEASADPAERRKAAGQPASKSRLSRTAGVPKPAGNQVAMQEENGDLEIPEFLKRQAN
jgi:cell division protein FtsZ